MTEPEAGTLKMDMSVGDPIATHIAEANMCTLGLQEFYRHHIGRTPNKLTEADRSLLNFYIGKFREHHLGAKKLLELPYGRDIQPKPRTPTEKETYNDALRESERNHKKTLSRLKYCLPKGRIPHAE